MNDTPEDTKLTRTKSRWAALGQFLTGTTSRPEDSRLPPGQHLVRNWPVLDLGQTPNVATQNWRLDIGGAVEFPVTWTWHDFQSAPQTKSVSDIHCVTTWSRYDNRWEGIHVRDLIKMVTLKPEAKHVSVLCDGGYTTNLTLAEFLDEDVMLAWGHDGKDLHPDHGFPLRLVVPKLYGWKSAKWVRAIEFTANDRRGFWEVRGYHNHGDPWAEERYSFQEEPED